MSPHSSNPIEWVLNHPPIFFILFGLVWVALMYFSALVGGWTALSNRFQLREKFFGKTWPFLSARMRFLTRYGNCLEIGADQSGLFLSVFPLFRIGHPPLLVPWQEISIDSGESGLIFKKRELRLGREEDIPFRISVSLCEKLQREAGAAWPVRA
ncbi:MAG TPA: hypothetical protein VEU52_08430 [Candidatus Limnocylindrales bacterium]|nr:hypothetical protein [Candidatus Limnocylindrales bacterium]